MADVGKKYLGLRDVHAYTKAFRLADLVWDLVEPWDFFARETVGKQFVRAVDSIAANIAEGFGRYTKKEKIQFYRYAHGSVMESLHWTAVAGKRRLITYDQYALVIRMLKTLPREIHHLIALTKQKLAI